MRTTARSLCLGGTTPPREPAMTDETIAPALRRLIGRHATVPTADAALLQRYAAANDADAFAALVRRHGPMVWGTAIKPSTPRREKQGERGRLPILLLPSRRAIVIYIT